MSADKRTVATDALETLGTIIGPNEKRDAIHLAVDPTIAGELLRAGDHVGLVKGKAVRNAPDLLGIVDPFLTVPVRANEQFWLVVYPRQISSLRHVWEHPKFPASGETSEQSVKDRAKARLEMIADDFRVSLSELLLHADDFLNHDEYWIEGGRFEGESIPADFWENYVRHTGKEVPQDKRWSFLSCSC